MCGARQSGRTNYARGQPGPPSFAGILAHIADANCLLCSYALGEPNPNGDALQGIEKANLERGALIAKLKETIAYCDRAYAQLTEANGNELVSYFGGQKRTRAGVLWFHVSHAFEHYGNLVTYRRLKRIVPPTSEPATTGREGVIPDVLANARARSSRPRSLPF